MNARRALNLELVPVANRPNYYAAMLGGRPPRATGCATTPG